MKLQKFKKIIAEASPESREEVRLAMDIQDRLHDLLELKFNGKQKLLAEKMKVSEAIVSKWFSGLQNFTTATIAKLQVAFGEPIIGVCSNRNEHITFEAITVPHHKEMKQVTVNSKGTLMENFVPIAFDKKKYQEGAASSPQSAA